MDHIPDFLTSHALQIGAVVVIAGISTYIIYKAVFKKQTWVDTDFPPDTVVLHHWPRGAYCPSLSPYVTKLESYFRMTKIPYVTKEHSMGTRGPKGKIPWITLNGQPLSDSQFIIEFLNKKFGVDLNRGLSDAERGVSRALQKLTEESIFWYLVMERFVFQSNWNWFTDQGLPSWGPRLARWKTTKMAYAQGIGRHSKEEVYHIMEDDITALSRVLGNKKFFFGAEPTEVDCTIFGFLTQCKYNLYGSRADKLMSVQSCRLVMHPRLNGDETLYYRFSEDMAPHSVMTDRHYRCYYISVIRHSVPCNINLHMNDNNITLVNPICEHLPYEAKMSIYTGYLLHNMLTGELRYFYPSRNTEVYNTRIRSSPTSTV